MGTCFMISDAAKKVSVEAHVLRYWEEELNMPIKRNELGHRYYTEEDIHIFQKVKELKGQGLQLKAIRMILKSGKLKTATVIEDLAADKIKKEDNSIMVYTSNKELTEKEDNKVDKTLRLQQLLQQMISTAVADSNRELCTDIKESVLKELDYQFRLQEKREEAREGERRNREEEHFRKFDELLRSHNKKSQPAKRFLERKKHSVK